MAKQRKNGETIKYGDGSIRTRERSDGGISYQARWHDGIQTRSKTFPDIEKAEDFLRQRGRDTRSGRYVADDDVTLLQALTAYLERGSYRWRASTTLQYRGIRDMVATYPIASQRLSDITTRHCQAWIDSLIDSYKPTRISLIRGFVSGALTEAIRLGSIRTNPMHGVRMPPRVADDAIVWTLEDALFALEVSKGRLHTYYTLALATGMRTGELRALKWSDIDMDEGVIRVCRTLTRNADGVTVIGKTTKNGHTRTLSVGDNVIAELKRHKAEQNQRRLACENWHSADLVFDNGTGRIWPQQTLWQQHRRFCEDHALPVCKVHSLRHTTTSSLIRGKMPVKAVSETLGHLSMNSIEDYAHSDDVQRKMIAEAMETMLFRRKEA